MLEKLSVFLAICDSISRTNDKHNSRPSKNAAYCHINLSCYTRQSNVAIGRIAFFVISLLAAANVHSFARWLGRHIPLVKSAASHGGLGPPPNKWFLGPTLVIPKPHIPKRNSPQTAYRSVQPFLHSSPECPIHRHTRRPRYVRQFCSNWPHLCTACRG